MSPLPAFDHNFVLPPHLGNPVSQTDISPYLCSITDFCNHFKTSEHRVRLLINLLEFRLRIYEYNLPDLFQWISGSFVEEIETSETRDPKDIDVLTFYTTPPPDLFKKIQVDFAEFISPKLSKANYLLDHYPINYALHPAVTVEYVRYWLQLFNHTRNGVWKGMVRLEFNDIEEDKTILAKLNAELS